MQIDTKQRVAAPGDAVQEEEILELELLDEEDVLPKAGAAKSRPTPLQWIKEHLPGKMQDPTQRKAGGNILKFLAVMLLLTLIARGTAGATLAAVTVARPGSADVISSVTGSGTVTASGQHVMELPDNLTIREMLVTPGQKVKEGDALAKMDAAEIETRLLREEATLKGLELELKTLLQKPIQDNSGVSSAQRSLTRAQQDLDAQRAAGNQLIAEAQAALDGANAALQQARDAEAALPPTATSDERAAAAAAVQQAQQAVNSAAAALEQTKTEVAAGLKAAERAVEDAQSALDSAKTQSAEAARNAANLAQENAIKAEKLRLDIDEQKKLVEKLQGVKDADNQLLATQSGIVMETAAEGTKTTGGAVVSLADTTGGFEVKVPVSKAQAQKLSPGDTAEVAQEGGNMYHNPVVIGTVVAVSQPDESGQCTVTIRLPEGEWKQGQNVQARIVQNRQTYSLCIPVGGLRSNSNGYFVLVVQSQNGVLGSENVVREVPVTLSAMDETNAAIEGPIGPNDQIVTGSTRPLEDGDRVRVET